MIYHVCVNGCDHAAGTKEAPFRTINRAAAVAAPGDTVQVHSGEYREWVDPRCGGLNDHCRIVYEAAPGEHPIIKGSEVITGWERVKGTVWKKVLPNAMFGDWNPYAQKVEGDWMEEPEDYDVHLGDVYINGVSMYEASSLEDLYSAPVRTQYLQNFWIFDPELVLEPQRTVYRWYCQVSDTETTLLCNFQDVDPNNALIEINVRKACFYPKTAGMNYITVRGFEMAHAACPFTPPTGDQVGLIGPHWSKGWIIENNHIHDAKCSGISLGKDATTGDNLSTRYGRKSGHRYQLESVFMGLQAGWCKEKIGSHIVRNNVIHDCGQNGIVGHMGSAFCIIEHNHIYNISTKREFWGHELGGIKFHAAVDTVIAHNNIHHCGLGTWLDWQSQGMRITGNLYHHNDRDLMIEVTHGPCTLDNNIFLSNFAFDNHAQGSAYVHNIIAGVARLRPILNRATPYHFPHSTQIMGCVNTYGGDDRVLNNLFLGVQEDKGEGAKRGYNFCCNYDVYSSPEEYQPLLRTTGKNHDLSTYLNTPQPVWIEGNAYAGFTKPFRKEADAILADSMAASIEECNGEWILTLNIPNTVVDASCAPVTTERLGMPRITEQPYENADGTPIDFTEDYLGGHRADNVIPGPFAVLKPGIQKIVVWKE